MTSADFLTALGWSDFFSSQTEDDNPEGLQPLRIATVHRARLTAVSPDGTVKLTLPPHTNTTDFAVGDWVLADRDTHRLHRRLTRKTLLERKIEGANAPQLIAANVDTLFIVSSCNADFNPARLERYLALANEAGTEPVILLTKADTTDEAESYRAKAETLQRGLRAVVLNARAPDAAKILAPWCGPGRTVTLVGSSGVGKSTLLNTLAGHPYGEAQETAAIREDDAKGRHTTTARSLHAIKGGGWVIDTPGIRSLHVSDLTSGIDTLFAEITELAPLCRFRDCKHISEPGCAVRAAVKAGTVDPDRFARWQKLRAEDAQSAQPTGYPRNTSAGKKQRTPPDPLKPHRR